MRYGLGLRRRLRLRPRRHCICRAAIGRSLPSWSARTLTGRGEWTEVRAFAEAVSNQLSNLAQVLRTGAALNPFPNLDQYVDQLGASVLGASVERLSQARLEEFSLDLKKELTSTLLALREQSIVHLQLKRITSYLRILQNAVRRLTWQEPRPAV
jgi:hypothetical protein